MIGRNIRPHLLVCGGALNSTSTNNRVTSSSSHFSYKVQTLRFFPTNRWVNLCSVIRFLITKLQALALLLNPTKKVRLISSITQIKI